MSAPPSEHFGYLKRKRQEQLQILKKLYAPRRPMAELPDEYHVTATNPKPPLLHFALPINDTVLYKYAEKHNLNKYYPCAPNMISPSTFFAAANHLSEEVQYELEFGFPLRITADCDFILGLYSNYSMEDKLLIEEDEEDVIQLVQEALELDKSVRPKWYFDFHDNWRPDDSDVEDTE